MDDARHSIAKKHDAAYEKNSAVSQEDFHE